MTRLGTGFALALLAGAVEAGLHAHALDAPRTSLERAHSSQLLAQVQAGRRSALVIGNGAYTEERLANAVNDAEAVARTLQEVGFSVTLVRNADKRTLVEALEAFSRRLGPGEIGLFYFSGHGVQVDGENYLVPINAQLSRQSDAQYDAVPLGKVINAVETTRASTKIIILDACRNNPFYRRWRSTSRGSATRGLATPLSSGDGGTLIAFSTAPGKEAADGIGSSPHSPFTTYLLRHLRTPNLEVGQLFRRVRGDVMQATRNQQIPWVSEALIGDVFLNQRTFGDAAAMSFSTGTSAQRSTPSLKTQPQPKDSEHQVLAVPRQPGQAESVIRVETQQAADQRQTDPLPWRMLGNVLSVAYSPDGTKIASSDDRGAVSILNAAGNQGVGSFRSISRDSIHSIAYSPNGRWLAAGTGEGHLLLIDSLKGGPLGPPLHGHRGVVWSVSFSPNGKLIASASADNTIRIWDAETMKHMLTLRGHTSDVNSVSFRPDGRQLVSGSSDNSVRLWNTKTGSPIGSPMIGHADLVRSVAFSPDGSRIVSGSQDQTLRLWDASALRPIGTPFKGHTYGILSLSFAPNGKIIVSGSIDGTLRVWDVATGKQMGLPLTGHEGWVQSVTFSPDGTRILSGSKDKTLRLWDANSGKEIEFPK
jgi:WD40 repeat protein